MCELLVEGGERLYGELTIQGSKNSVLPILAATLLCADTCVIENCPKLRDVEASVAILRHLGCCTHWEGGALVVDTARMDRCTVPDALMREMRSSVIFLGAILARCKEATICYPGGCELGPRPIARWARRSGKRAANSNAAAEGSSGAMCTYPCRALARRKTRSSAPAAQTV